MKLVNQLEYIPGRTHYPDCLAEKSQALILEWCLQHGLLGVLLSRWEAIRLAPTEHGVERWSQRSYFRAFGQVVQVQTVTGDVKDRSATVLIHALDDFKLEEETPSSTWSRFFPTVKFSKRDALSYPQPYTAAFSRLYGEPLFDFCKAAQLLVGAISHLGREQPQIEGDPKLAREQALHVINALRRPIASVLDFEEQGSVKARRVAPSLLASFAEMFAQDLIYGRVILQCTCCGTPFVSNAYQAQYCSVLCRLRKQKRRLRAQMKHARKLRKEGQNLRQIANTIGQPVVIVRGWLKNSK